MPEFIVYRLTVSNIFHNIWPVLFAASYFWPVGNTFILLGNQKKIRERDWKSTMGTLFKVKPLLKAIKQVYRFLLKCNFGAVFGVAKVILVSPYLCPFWSSP